ncbi:MAG: ribosome silencing factor [Gemmataceae bacterium]|nr:ribosome silencing factor [Gemmataceae bacterium]
MLNKTLVGETTHLATALERACICAVTAQENKGRDVLVLDMRGISRLYDYFVIATGTSKRQIHNIAEEVDDAMKHAGDKRAGIEGYEASRWVVQDYGDVMVHVFDQDARKYYTLEELWADAPRVDWENS